MTLIIHAVPQWKGNKEDNGFQGVVQSALVMYYWWCNWWRSYLNSSLTAASLLIEGPVLSCDLQNSVDMPTYGFLKDVMDGNRVRHLLLFKWKFLKLFNHIAFISWNLTALLPFCYLLLFNIFPLLILTRWLSFLHLILRWKRVFHEELLEFLFYFSLLFKLFRTEILILFAAWFSF